MNKYVTGKDMRLGIAMAIGQTYNEIQRIKRMRRLSRIEREAGLKAARSQLREMLAIRRIIRNAISPNGEYLWDYPEHNMADAVMKAAREED